MKKEGGSSTPRARASFTRRKTAGALPKSWNRDE
jgi:hypothetical protein